MRPPPRIWWDGADFHVLAPTYVDEDGRSTLPGLYRVAEAGQLAWLTERVELLPAHSVAGLDDTAAGRVVASVVFEQRQRRPLWLRRLRCFTLGHSPVGAEFPAGGGEGWSFLVCRTCERRVTR